MTSIRQLVLIGGAPRTGTSMMVRSLDWHPDLLMFPREPAYLAQLFLDRGAGEPSTNGKEFVFSERQRLEALTKVFADLGEPDIVDFYRQYDTVAFATTYDKIYMENRVRSPLYGYIAGLYAGLIAGSPRLQQRYGNRGAIAFSLKMPFFIEAAFELYLALPADVRLIYLDREPVARYASAKARSIPPSGSLAVAGGLDFATF